MKSIYSLLQKLIFLWLAIIFLPIWTSKQCSRKWWSSPPTWEGNSFWNRFQFGCVFLRTKVELTKQGPCSASGVSTAARSESLVLCYGMCWECECLQMQLLWIILCSNKVAPTGILCMDHKVLKCGWLVVVCRCNLLILLGWLWVGADGRLECNQLWFESPWMIADTCNRFV